MCLDEMVTFSTIHDYVSHANCKKGKVTGNSCEL
jgi:hypothetical protein